MTRKDFQLIADVLSKHRAYTTGLGSNELTKLVDAMALDFAHALKDTNPRFDVQRFVVACAKESS
jgi:hypothetical protein